MNSCYFNFKVFFWLFSSRHILPGRRRRSGTGSAGSGGLVTLDNSHRTLSTAVKSLIFEVKDRPRCHCHYRAVLCGRWRAAAWKANDATIKRFAVGDNRAGNDSGAFRPATTDTWTSVTHRIFGNYNYEKPPARVPNPPQLGLRSRPSSSPTNT